MRSSLNAAPPTATQRPGCSRWQTWPVRRKKVPVIIQMNTVECGAACLAMILSYYGRQSGICEVRERCGVGRDGISARGLVQAAGAYGLRTRALRVESHELRFVALPAIIHWDFNHFLVLERWSAHVIDVVDPAQGRRRLSRAEFEQHFTGIVLLLEPGTTFAPGKSTATISTRAYAARYLKMAPLSVCQVIGASLLLQLFGLALPLLTKVVVDQLLPLGLLNELALLGLGMLILFLAQLVTTLLRGLVLLYIQTRIDIQMMLSFFEHLLTLPVRFFQQHSSGDLIARMASNQSIRDTLSNQLVSSLLDGSFVLVYFLLLLSQSRVYSLVVLCIGLLQVALLLTSGRLMHRLSQQVLVAQGRAVGYATEVLVGMPTLKAMGAEQAAMEQWSNLFFDGINTSVRQHTATTLLSTALSAISSGAPLALLWLGTAQVLAGQLPLGTMLALNALGIAFLTPLATLVSSGQNLQLIASHLERISDVLETAAEQEPSSSQLPGQLRGTVRLEHVDFRYDAQASLVLKDINLTISAGQRVAIVGRTGSGKSTLGHLLLGLYLPTEGSIFYDDLPLVQLNYQAVRSQFGVVIQNSRLFSGTIRENMLLGNAAADMAQIIQAARMAGIHEEIMQMPMKYETRVSEDGTVLSGGQRQRIALARALVTRPVLLLLDEATSALDVSTELAIAHQLQELACTQIIIAHRLSTVRHADLILVLDQGTISEQGSHEELVHKQGVYARLIRDQLEPGELAAGS
ncbi:MAG TPA: peptidase domain-containing ABC transporter [Ktedonobacteraceae bacterium]